MSKIIALLTDFGLVDPYVAQMKGAMLQYCMDCQIVDISHEVRPFQVAQAGFFLEASRKFYPKPTVFVAVVDPTVGSERRIVCVQKHGHLFVAPDNGLLSCVLDAPSHDAALAVDVTPRSKAYQGSATFHGRDIMALVAARLAQGDTPHELGEEVAIDSLVRIPGVSPVEQGSEISTTVLHVDRFGNIGLSASIDLWQERLWASESLRIKAPHPATLHRVSSYAELKGKHVGILPGSQGFLEIALNTVSAAEALDVDLGDTIVLTTDAE